MNTLLAIPRVPLPDGQQPKLCGYLGINKGTCTGIIHLYAGSTSFNTSIDTHLKFAHTPLQNSMRI